MPFDLPPKTTGWLLEFPTLWLTNRVGASGFPDPLACLPEPLLGIQNLSAILSKILDFQTLWIVPRPLASLPDPLTSFLEPLSRLLTFYVTFPLAACKISAPLTR